MQRYLIMKAIKSKSEFNWEKLLEQKRTRIAIANMVSTCTAGGVRLNSRGSIAAFVSGLITFAPEAEQFLPSNFCLDLKPVGRQKKRVKSGVPSSDGAVSDSALVCALLALMSKGVKELEFEYIGGWDETELSDAPHITFRNELHKSNFVGRGFSEAVIRQSRTIINWVWNQTGVSNTDIMYRLMDDSGAGPPRYSQSLTISLDTWKVKKHSYKIDREI